MRISSLTAAAVAAQVVIVSQALAQNGFNGAYAGAEISYADREFSAVERAISIPEDPTDFIGVGVDDEAVTFGGFVGWGALVSDNLYLGVELGLGSGGDEVVHDMTEDVSLAIEPQLRLGGAARVGILLGDMNLAYAKLGYEMREYELTTSQGVSDSDELGGVLYGVGLERLFGERLSIRAEVSHVSVDADDSEFQLGVNQCGGSVPAPCVFIPVGFPLEPEETRATLGAAIRF
jgi:opacity protein-like surface antigen